MKDTNNFLVSSKKIILGIDPGSNITGYGVVIKEKKKVSLVTIGHIHMEKYDDHYDKLSRIFHRVKELIATYQPHEIALEAPIYAQNIQSMLKLGRAQGMSIAAALNSHIPIFEYSPKSVKKSVTGNGNASKESVASMLPHILNTPIDKDQLDATDGLAVAVCHHFQSGRSAAPGKKANTWQAFIKEHPDRVK
ncbi:MAG: crossover junction endodeoxyribonuclease RuvC [Bacteroidetes bacterium]|nr:crossover junction endodeoxyribonuclease RuvC [Bacteroidota bacterium]